MQANERAKTVDPITSAIIGGLAANLKTIAELILSISDKSMKSQLESVKEQVNLAKTQLEFVAKERDNFKEILAVLKKENEELAEKIAYYEVTQVFDMKEGLLYTKGTEDGPYCPIDRIHMTFQGEFPKQKFWKCPKCGHDASTSKRK